MAERDFLAATRERVVVFDGGMGATLEQFDLTQEDYGGLLGKCHEALVLNRPDVIEGVHTSMLEAGAEVVETDTFQGSRLKLDEWGLGEHTLEINTQGRRNRPQGGRRGPLRRRLDRPDRLPARLRRPDPRRHLLRRRWSRSSPSRRRGLVEGGADLIIIETAQDILEVKAAIFGAREAFAETGRTLPIQTSVSLLPNGGKMLLGTDIQAVLTTLRGARRRRDRAQLLDRARGHARRDPLPRRDQPAAGPLHPQRRPAAAGARRRDDLPRRARAAGGDPRRVRRALRRRHRRRLLRDDARAHRRDPRAGRRPASPASAPRRARSRSPR